MKSIQLIIKISVIMIFSLSSVFTMAQEKPKVYLVATAHFDTQWNWDVQISIRDYLLKTLEQNLFLLKNYPNYLFNFEGGVKYQWMKEYYPDQYEKVKEYVRQGRWHIAGSSWDANDVNIPSPESFTRNILYGQMFYQDEFGVRGTDLFLPDCFGFGWTLPTIAAHSGLIGFSTSKLQGGRTKPFFENNKKIPFDIGLWKGIDGSKIMLVPHGYSYVKRWSVQDLSNDTTLFGLADRSPLKTVYHYYGVGDTGGAPTIESVMSVEEGLKGNGPVKIVSATSDRLYKDYLPFDKHPELPVYSGELLMDLHGTGCYTSQAAMKLYNRKNEQLGDVAERAAVVAQWTRGQEYPGKTINEAWKRFIWHQFHDDLTGTSLPRAYEFSWNDELLSQKEFAQTLTTSVGAVSRILNTQVKGIPLVINNPVAQPVKDILEISIEGMPTKQFGVYDENGKPVPSQFVSVDGQEKLLIAAHVKPMSFTVYELLAGGRNSKATALRVTANTIENSIYKVRLNANGDIASIIDKRYNVELVKAGKTIRLALFTENESLNWPAWEIKKATIDRPAIDITGDVTIKIVENGPVRASLCVERKYGESTFRQYIRLTEGGQDDRIDFVNEIDWQTTNALLKAEFSLNIENESATYDLGIGTVERKTNTDLAYEVPAQYWADLTSKDLSYGVSILNDCKVGWDKPDDNTLRLTLLNTPKSITRKPYQNFQDFGFHTFTYSIMGHKGSYRDAQTIVKAEILNRPLTAYTTGKHAGTAGRSFSFLQTFDDRMMVKALKKAENSNEYVIRLYESTGKDVNNFSITFASEILSAKVLNGMEDVAGDAVFNGKNLIINAKPYSINTFSLRLKPGTFPPLTLPVSIPVDLKYNTRTATINAYRSDANIDGEGYSYAAELLPPKLHSSGIEFKLGNPVLENAIKCGGDTIILPQNGQYNKLYLLASSISDDVFATFYVDGKPTELLIPYYSGFIGQWGHTGHTEGFFKPAEVAYTGTHRHHFYNVIVSDYRECIRSDAHYEFTYMFKYCIDIHRNAKKLVLPNDPKVLVFAVSLGANENDNIVPVVDLIATSLKHEDLKP